MITATNPNLLCPPLLVGLLGRAGAGKTTVAHELEHEYGFAHLAFADPIVDMIGALLATAEAGSGYMTERALKETPIPQLGVSYRRLAQTLGTDWGRDLVAPDLWLRVMAARLSAPGLQGESVVISDVRFANEAAAIRARGGVLVRVLRRQEDLPVVAQHVSETEGDSLAADHELFNYGSLATLAEQVERLIDSLRGRPAHQQTREAA